MNTNSLLQQIKIKQAMREQYKAVMSQTMSDHNTGGSFMKQAAHRSHSINPNHQGGLTTHRQHAGGRMRELIVTNFMKKYLS